MWEVICGRRPRGQRVRLIHSFRGLTTVWVIFFGIASAASAGVYSFQWDRPPGFDGDAGPFFADDGAGVLNSLTLSYDSDAQRLTFLAAFEEEPDTGNLPFGFSLMLNNGPEPMGGPDEYAVLRFLSLGESHDPLLSAHVYNGSGKEDKQLPHQGSKRIVSSWKDDGWVHSAGVVDSPAGRVFSFDIDVSDINGFEPKHGDPADWFGIGFDDTIGLWMNSFALDWPGKSGEAPGRAHSRAVGPWPHMDRGFFDFADQPTNVNIPEPASLGLMTLGAWLLTGRVSHPARR